MGGEDILLGGTVEQREEALKNWDQILNKRGKGNSDPEDWYVAGYYCRMLGMQLTDDRLNNPDPAEQAWVLGWRDADGDLLFNA